MRKFFFSDEAVNTGANVCVSGATAHHILHVLRMKIGESVTFGDKQGADFICSLDSFDRKTNSLVFTITEVVENKTELPYKVTLFQSLPQGSGKMEEIIQKCVELGVYTITPVYSDFSRQKIKDDNSRLKRYQRIAEMAAGQSRRSIIPLISSFLTFNDALRNNPSEQLWLVASENEHSRTIKAAAARASLSNIGIWIGPEGGFSINEYSLLNAAGAIPVTLGRRILRTETAGMAALVHLQCALGAESL